MTASSAKHFKHAHSKNEAQSTNFKCNDSIYISSRNKRDLSYYMAKSAHHYLSIVRDYLNEAEQIIYLSKPKVFQ